MNSIYLKRRLKVLKRLEKRFNLQEGLKFILVGCISAVVDIFLLNIFIHLEYGQFMSVSIGFIGGIFINYYLHSKFTFKIQPSLLSSLKYTVVLFINYILSLLIIYALSFFNININLSKILSLFIVFINGYTFSKIWIFK